MNQTRQGVQSMLVKAKIQGEKKNSDTYEDESTNNKRDIILKTYFTKDTVYTDQTEKYQYNHTAAASTRWLCVKYTEMK